MAEVYNEHVSDLLSGGREVAVRQHPQRGFYADGLRNVVCATAEEALAVLQCALTQRCAFDPCGDGRYASFTGM